MVTTSDRNFALEGRVQLEAGADTSPNFKLQAYVFNSAGELLAKSEIDEKGNFSLPLRLQKPIAVELVIGPAGNPTTVRDSSAYSQRFTAKDWLQTEGGLRIKPNLRIPQSIWLPWRPVRLCVSGHIRKLTSVDGNPAVCPVPFVKVEVFDVDREPCLWPFIRYRWPDLLDRPVIRLPDLMQQPSILPDPLPGPDPAPFAQMARLGLDSRALVPAIATPRLSPLPTGLASEAAPMTLALPQLAETGLPSAATQLRVGELKQVSEDIARRLETLTLTSEQAPWALFSNCFYSRELICETTTDCNGYFHCCFNWWPFHFRRGRLRFDSKPDILLRVTQIIDGVETVIYLDPYTSTRWNADNVHIDLYLDNEAVQCGSSCDPQPAGNPVFFTRVGLDEVYQINQTSGLFSNTAFGGVLSNWAYGGSLLLAAVFGDGLSTGTPKRYYRLSYAKKTSSATPPAAAFKPITTALADTRVSKAALESESYYLGPQAINGTPNLYEIRNTQNYYWYNRDKIGLWNTEAIEADAGLYVLRLEVFNDLGVKLTSTDVDYRDGTDAPPGPLPVLTNHCDLVIQIDNQAPTLALEVPAANGDCGVVPFSAIADLTLDITVNQDNGRLYQWGLNSVKGLTGVSNGLASGSSNSGITPLPISASIAATPLTTGLVSTCAFALTLGAWPLVRNGYGVIHPAELTKAIAIEKCNCP